MLMAVLASATLSFGSMTLTVPTVIVQEQFVAPGKNKFVWVQSPNFNARPPGTIVDTIVLHHTASDNLAGTVKWFQMESSQASAHFTIGKDGSIVQHLSTFDRAWHAGQSKDRSERPNVNNYSIGIEMVNTGSGTDPWTPEQVEACYLLCAHLIRHRFPEIKQITSHEFIAIPPGRKKDPKNFPWDALKPLGVDLVYGLNKS